ncbi:F0F1 ATP synthase subunit [Defluviitalea raffinosedens]|uniref:F0F1 ATP synthase subunit n=1 Tax=Defluviitalea raffinosedens TaxID=1450156 RepID=A0A7C8LU07_9FIRM|nr:AtpZ/AtpI family protein [Defluviitalea raffinosedens]KAE9635630.1 F0F1 ATP synthase subunit [Defluviitalea raffinosedens]
MNKKTGIIAALSLLSQMGIMMALPIIGCIILGNYLDNRFHSGILFLLIFVILGVGAAFRNLFVLTRKVQNNKEKRKDK